MIKKKIACVLLAVCSAVICSCSKNNIVTEVTSEESTTLNTEDTVASDESTEIVCDETSSVTTTAPSSLSIPELSKEEIYEDIADQLLCRWAALSSYTNLGEELLRQYKTFDQTMMIEMTMTSELIQPLDLNKRVSSREHIFDYFHCVKAEGADVPLDYISFVCEYLFGVEVSDEDIVNALSTDDTCFEVLLNNDQNGVVYQRHPAYYRELSDGEYTYDFESVIKYEITDCGDDDFSCEIYYADEYDHNDDGSLKKIENIATVNVEVEWSEEDYLGFEINNISVDFDGEE